MDAIAFVKQDHALIKALFKDFQSLGEEEAHSRRGKLVAEMIRELSFHAAMEEAALYPYAKQRDERLSGRVAEALEEHKVAKWELLALERLQPGDERYNAKVKVLIDSVLHHMEEEESIILARLRELCTEDELLALADALKTAKKAAPSRPHPRLPDEPPGNTMMVPMVAAMDRSLDRASRTLERGRDLAEVALDRGRALVNRLRSRMTTGADEARRRMVARADEARRRVSRVSGTVRRRAIETTGELREDAARLGRQVRRVAMEQGEEIRRGAARTFRQVGESAAETGREIRQASNRTARKAAPAKKTAPRKRPAAAKTARPRSRTAGKTTRPRKRR